MHRKLLVLLLLLASTCSFAHDRRRQQKKSRPQAHAGQAHAAKTQTRTSKAQSRAHSSKSQASASQAHASQPRSAVYVTPKPVELDREGALWAEKTLKRLSLEEEIGQMMMVWARAEPGNPGYQRVAETIRRYHVGALGLTVPQQGAIIHYGDPYEAAALINRFQNGSKIPLIVAADFERGLSMRLNRVTMFPYAMAFGAAGSTSYAERFGRITAEEARAIGVHWNFFPVADVNSNPANPIINTRAFGEDPQRVSDMVAAYIRGARAGGMLTTAKHFPGHGDTAADSHLGLAEVTVDRDHLEHVELQPFRSAIAAGVDAVMVSHVSVPSLDPDHLASISPLVIQDVLRRELGFDGLVVTDQLEMASIAKLYSGRGGSGQAAVDAVKAGNDLLLVSDISAFNAVLHAVCEGEISRSQIDASVLRILRLKASLGLHKAKLVDLAALSGRIARPDNQAFAQQVADDAVTLVRDDNHLLPFEASRGTNLADNSYIRLVGLDSRLVAVIFTDDVRAEMGHVFEHQLRARVPDANVIYVDPTNALVERDAVMATVSHAENVIAAIYVAPTSGKSVKVNGTMRNSVSLGETSASLLRDILTTAGERTAVVALGNPYIAADFPRAKTYLCTFSSSQVSEISAVRALFGDMTVHGKLPVTIPNVAARGSGLLLKPATNERELLGGGGGEFHEVEALSGRSH
jgi:beta-N-acetylhexosaminidase